MVDVTGSDALGGTNQNAENDFGNQAFWFEWVELFGPWAGNLADAGFNLDGSLGASQTVYNAGGSDVLNVPAQYPTLGNDGDNFAVRISTTLTVTTEGVYTFELSSDDGSIIYIDGVEVVNYDGLHAADGPVVDSTFLSAGEHEVVIVHFEAGGLESVSATISGPDYTGTVQLQDANVQANAGADTIDAGDGNDTIDAGDGDDVINGEAGDDTIVGGAGNDTIDGGAGADIISGGDGDDVIVGGADTTATVNIIGGTLAAYQVNEQFNIGSGNFNVATATGLTFSGGPVAVTFIDDDTILDQDDPNETISDTNQFVVIGGTQYPVLVDYGLNYTDQFGNNYTFQVVDVDLNNNGDVGLFAGGADTSEDGVLLIRTAGPEIPPGAVLNVVDGSVDQDAVLLYEALPAADTDLPDGADTIDGGAGSDTIDGAGGNDTIDGGGDDDLILASVGSDGIDGGAGNDTYSVPGGSTIAGGTETITVTVDNTGNGTVVKDVDGTTDTIGNVENFVADEASAENDVIVLTTVVTDEGTISGLSGTSGVFVPANAGNPSIAFGGAGEPTFDEVLSLVREGQFTVNGASLTGAVGDISFQNFETVEFGVVCFAQGTRIKTDRGEMAIESLKAGDLVKTLDKGLMPIRWVGSRQINADELHAQPKLRPIRIRAGALADHVPVRDLVVSPQHRILVHSKIAVRMFATKEVLVAAKNLVGLPGVEVVDDCERVEYFHILMDEHEIVTADGALSETLHTGAQAVKMLRPAQQEEVHAIFPNLTAEVGHLARTAPKGRAARKLVDRHKSNRKQLQRAMSSPI